MGGLLAGPPVPEWCYPQQLAPYSKIDYFPDPSKNGSEWSRHRFLTDFDRFWAAVWSTLATGFLKNTKNLKVRLDCAGVYGSHTRPSRKLYFVGILLLIFCCFSQGPFLMLFFGAAATEASKMPSQRVPLLPCVGHFIPKLVPLGATGFQNDGPGPKTDPTSLPREPLRRKMCSKWP